MIHCLHLSGVITRNRHAHGRRFKMNAEAVFAIAGVVLIVTAVIGGGFEAREIKIPPLPILSRVVAGSLGVAFIAIVLLDGFLDDGTPLPGAPTPTSTSQISRSPTSSRIDYDSVISIASQCEEQTLCIDDIRVDHEEGTVAMTVLNQSTVDSIVQIVSCYVYGADYVPGLIEECDDSGVVNIPSNSSFEWGWRSEGLRLSSLELTEAPTTVIVQAELFDPGVRELARIAITLNRSP